MSNYGLKFDDLTQGGPTTLVNVASKSASQWFGRTATFSDTLGPACVVSTFLIGSASLVWFFPQLAFGAGSNVPAVPFVVSTISPALPGGVTGGFFRIQAVSSCTNVGGWVIGWAIVNPQKINPST